MAKKKADSPTNYLNDFIKVEEFLRDSLQFEYSDYSIVADIVQTELNLTNFRRDSDTLSSKRFRAPEFRAERKRKKLQREIVNELITQRRLDDDDKIKLGHGGARPSQYIRDRNAYILLGLPASGKSRIANHIADVNNAVILDSDFAKRKLPEYNMVKFGATLVHEESHHIVFGKDPKFISLFDYCMDSDLNIVIPKIGHNSESIILLIKALQEKLYKIHITLIDADPKTASARALKRFNKSKRYVPLGIIFNEFGIKPRLTYEEIKKSHHNILESYGVINTEERPNKVIEVSNIYNPANLFVNERIEEEVNK